MVDFSKAKMNRLVEWINEEAQYTNDRLGLPEYFNPDECKLQKTGLQIMLYSVKERVASMGWKLSATWKIS